MFYELAGEERDPDDDMLSSLSALGSAGLSRFNSHAAARDALYSLPTEHIEVLSSQDCLRKWRHFWAYLAQMQVVRVQVRCSTVQSA